VNLLTDWTQIFEKLRPLPWKLWAIVVASSFILASIVSLVILVLTMPDGAKRPVSSGSPVANVEDPGVGGATLDKAALDRIISRNIFNMDGDSSSTDPKPAQANQQVAEIVKTDLPVKLRGVIYGGDPFSGIAVVENTSKQSINSFMVSEQLDKDTTVLEIHEEKVIIERNGRKEFIPLDVPDIMRSQRRRTRSRPAAGDTGDPGSRPLATEPPPETYKEEGFSRVGGEIEISGLKKNALITQELPTVLQDAKAEPHTVDGAVAGWRLERIRKDSIYDKAGFQNGDVIKEINGVSLNDAAQAIKLLQSLRNEAEIDIRFSRGGVDRSANIKVR